MQNTTTLIPVNLKNIVLNENAYFYKVTNNITKNQILAFFQESLQDKNATRKFQVRVKEPFLDGGKEIAKFSLDIFEFKRKPSFFKEKEQGKWEIKYGLFLIVEHGNYLALLRKNVSGVDSVNSYIENIDYEILSHCLITQKSKFEKIVSNNMNTSDTAIQRKITEARDLKGIYSRFGASKQIINSIRLDNDGEKVTVALNTSRINSFNLKCEFDDIVFWIVQVLKLIDKAFKNLPQSPFIDGFATPLKFEDIIDELEPTYLLLRFGALKDDIDSNIIEKCYVKEKDKEIPINLLEKISKNEKLFDLKKADERSYKNGDLHIKINQHSISISHNEFKNIYLDFGNEVITTLNQYINNGNHFIVNFNKVDHVYSHRKIFKDSKLLNDTENFFNTFWEFDELTKIQSEKGNNYTTKSKEFEDSSLFGFIENKFKPNSQVLICDDMGTEWGDFISIGQDEIAFYHAKHNSEGLSASNLEEVFGQVQKNFGYLELDNDMIDYRKDRWSSCYNYDKVQTNIERIRKCPKSSDKIKTIKDIVNSVSANPNLRRKVYIVIDFISKSKLKNAINELKQGNKFDNKGVTLQMLWFINSLLSSANELNTELRILCRP